jgi:phospholipid/cholesterol/gamma-HCH transport system substrate-binding protein
MSQPRFEIKVGAFVFIGLALLATLVILLSKGTSFYHQTFELRLKSDNVGGIKTGAGILLSGVSVGRVAGVELEPDGKSVTIQLKIFKKYKIYDDAAFDIEQFGFLGDQFVAIRPGANQGRLLKNGDEVQCGTPFNMQETVATAAETISKIGAVATNVQQAVTDVREHVLTEENLKSFGSALGRFGVLSSEALVAVSNINALVGSNALPLTLAVSNLNNFATELSPVALRASTLLSNNEDQITAAIHNIETTSTQLTNLMNRLQTAQGLAVRLVNDRQLADDFADLAYNLAITTSNLNSRGLWGIMWKQKAPPPPRQHGPENNEQ